MTGGLRDAFEAFDPAALEVLANKGLVRRAQRDIQDGKISVVESDGTSAKLSADGETVAIDTRGPAAATCSCPAPGICRHRLAATLLLRSMVADAADQPAGHAEEDRAAALRSEIEALEPARIARWAGKASWRAALELAEAGGTVEIAGASVVVRIGAGDGEVRYLAGQGLAGMVSKAKAARAKATHAAAALMIRCHFGFASEMDQAPAPEDDAPVRTVDAGFLGEVEAAIAQYAHCALNLAPVALEEQLFMLSVSSRADHLPRLSGLLRTLSSLLAERRTRGLAADPDRCLVLAAEAFALARSLGLRGDRSDAPADALLIGAARQGYAPVGDLQLVGMGGEVWRTPAGARGVTAYFFAPADARWFTASLSRGAGQDPGFDPVRAYRQEAVWTGPTLEELSRSRFRLDNATASDSGRLSMAAGISAIGLQGRAAEEAEMANAAFRSWSDLRRHLRSCLSGGIAQPKAGTETVILHPRRVGRPWFDDLRQSLIWPVEDQDGGWIGLSVDHGVDRDGLVTALEKVASDGWHGTIVASASIAGRSFALRPFALADGNDLFNLGLDDIRTLSGFGLGRIARGFVRDLGMLVGRLPRAFVRTAPSIPQSALSGSWQLLVDVAELGMDGLTRDQSDRMAIAAQRLRAVGLATVAATVELCAEAPARERWPHLLAAAYAIRLAQMRTIDLPALVRA